ncbi:uncharacterized protein LOC133713469 isoform X2 [Rosa rugosa]|uniref:uncharacterized protein LOC133713469 isoform X2 n=1 Tax=Rosa rugosa TaxID=74645 RepID=UPI002B40A7C0|nr:uncharacterized protein LOC133713469 isoform X2 [Rosa rugosa]
MSFRNMLKVSFLMLLAMALAATSVHARLDLFGQLLTSKNQPEPNSECQQIPYLLCIRICDACICDKRAAEFAECTCAEWKPTAELQKSDDPAQCCSLGGRETWRAKSIAGIITERGAICAGV